MKPGSHTSTTGLADAKKNFSTDFEEAVPLEKETRFAVVMYGGVSLAIYIYGVAKELYSMVRATARRIDKDNHYLLEEDKGELSETEKVYREIGKSLKTKFVVDILSGTSAGGINSVYLAKALVNGQSFDMLKDVWLNQGDIGVLINDNKSKVKGMDTQNPPRSLLNSQRMYYYLLDALDQMDAKGRITPPNAPLSPFVTELDLHITATDIRGLPVELRISNAQSSELRFKNVFSFQYLTRNAPGGDEERGAAANDAEETINDFTKKDNPFLAFAARCTSAFPFAFEPMRLEEIEEVLNLDRFKKADYRYPRSVHEKWGKFFKDYEKKGHDFQKQSFGDGGYIDNKPFSYATETLLRRRADYPVDRKLVYIDPSPEHPEVAAKKGEKPDALENVMAALLSIPRYEPIREDLEKVLERNRIVRHFNRIFSNIEQLVATKPETVVQSGIRNNVPEWQKDGRKWAKKFIDDSEVLNAYGVGYAAYHQLRVASVLDNLNDAFCRGLDYEVNDKRAESLRVILEGWRKTYYAARKPSTTFEEDGIQFPLSENDILFRLDTTWRMRRLFFLQNIINRLFKLVASFDKTDIEKQKAGDFSMDFLKKTLADVKNLLREGLPQKGKVKFSTSSLNTVDGIVKELGSIRETLLECKKNLNESYAHLRMRGRKLRCFSTADVDRVDLDESLRNYLNALSELKALLDDSKKGVNHLEKLAQEAEVYFTSSTLPGSGGGVLFADLDQVFHQIEKITGLMAEHFLDSTSTNSDSPKAYIHETLSLSNAELKKVFEQKKNTAVVNYLSYYLDRFEYYDMQFFPMQYGTSVGESDEVEIIRISPEDAINLVNEEKIERKKLAGTTLANFGAFFAREWRENDMMWGRLDAAECLVKSLMGEGESSDKLIEDLHRAILKDELTSRDEALILKAQAEIKGRYDEAGTEDIEAEPEDKINAARSNLITKYHRYRNSLKKNGEVKWLYQAIHRLSKPERLLERFKSGYMNKDLIDREFPPRETLAAGSRALHVVSSMLNELSKKYESLTNPAKWIATAGGVLAGILAAALPNSISGRLVGYWIGLLYIFELLLVAIGVLLKSSGLKELGIFVLVLTALTHLLIKLVNGWMARSVKLRTLLNVLKILAAIVIVSLILGGGVMAYLGLLGLDIINFPGGVPGELLGQLIQECPKTLPTDGMLFCRPAE